MGQNHSFLPAPLNMGFGLSFLSQIFEGIDFAKGAKN